MIDIFRAVRERVSAQEAAQCYGLTFDRAGRALCPFHSDRHPSLSFRDGRVRCWACQASGDSIDFTGRLLGLDALGAAERLNADFDLGLPFHRKPTKADVAAVKRRKALAEVQQAFEAWRKETLYQLCACFRTAHALLLEMPEQLTEAQALAIQWAATADYLIGILQDGTIHEQMTVFREREVLRQRIGKILHSTPAKSIVA